MITMKSYNNSDVKLKLKSIVAIDSILIIGRGSNEYKLNEIIKPKNPYDALNMYGECELVTAYKEAYSVGARNIYLLNAYKTTDFIECIKNISYLNFSYIVPIEIKISDTFYNSDYGREIFFAEYYLNETYGNSNSVFVFTDEHADFYENITDFINDMHKKILNFKMQTEYILEFKGTDILFCTNNLSSIKYANAVLAATLAITSLGDYPEPINNKAVFDIDSEDISQQEIIYFKNNYLINTSIENLNNFRIKYDANKIEIINMVIKGIERKIDLSFVLGKYYNNFLKIQIKDYLNNELRIFKESSIKNYAIKNIEFIADKNSLSGVINVYIDIYPKNSIEKISTILEVN